jgi:hypothetical protein
VLARITTHNAAFQENNMTQPFHANGCWRWASRRRWRAAPAFAAKDVVVAVGSNFTTLDPYDANDTLSQAVAKSSKGCSALIKR